MFSTVYNSRTEKTASRRTLVGRRQLEKLMLLAWLIVSGKPFALFYCSWLWKESVFSLLLRYGCVTCMTSALSRPHKRLKADSRIACRAHAVPLPCRALIHTCHAARLPCSDSFVSFVKVHVVAGNIRTASPTV